MSRSALSRDHFTYGSYRRWPDDRRRDLIGGEVHDMSTAPRRIHQATVVELSRQG